MAKVSIGGSSLDDRELIALAGNDTVTSPVTLCLKKFKDYISNPVVSSRQYTRDFAYFDTIVYSKRAETQLN